MGFAFNDTVEGGGTKPRRERGSETSFVPVLTKPVIRVAAKKVEPGAAVEAHRDARPTSMPPQVSVAVGMSPLLDVAIGDL